MKIWEIKGEYRFCVEKNHFCSIIIEKHLQQVHKVIIDFHTHIFPDDIAERAIAKLSGVSGLRPFTDGTLRGLKESMKKGGIDYSVILPVATAPRQVESINRMAAELNGKDGIIYAGAIHPDCGDVEGILDGIRAAGLFGIKLHPDYQGTFFDDDRYLRILEEAAKRELITVTHAGVDIGYPKVIHCTPDRILNALNALKGVIDDKLVVAPLGGYGSCREILKKRAGQRIYSDTASVLHISPEKAKSIIEAHGTDKVLFATDSPWSGQREYVELISSLGFTDTELEKMLCGNAKKLLKM